MNWPGDYVNQIIEGDCLEVMKGIPDGAVDLILADPQYEKEAHTPMRRTRASIEGRRQGGSDVIPFACMDETTRRGFVQEALRICAGWILVFSQVESVGKYQELFGDSWRRAMVWIKPDSAPQFSGDRPAMGYESICAAWAGNRKAQWSGGGTRGVFYANCTDYEHLTPTQKPLNLICKLINLFSNPSDLLLDPFLGSGTTVVAATKTHRQFIGIERVPETCAIARRRVSEARQQQDLFRKPETVEQTQML